MILNFFSIIKLNWVGLSTFFVLVQNEDSNSSPLSLNSKSIPFYYKVVGESAWDMY